MKRYIFIDESGSPHFYGKRKRPLWIEPHFVPIFFMGMVTTDDRVKLRKSVQDFQSHVLNDPLFNSIYSVTQPGWYLHARTDYSDINLKMTELLRQLDGFKFNAVIGRKIPEIFFNKHNGNAIEFYFDLIQKLLELDHLEPDTSYHLYLSHRQNNTEQRFTEAFKKVVKSKSMKLEEIKFSCSIVQSCDCPEMSVVDYFLWALQRYILKGERRYFTALEKHCEKILDVYESGGLGKLYDAKDPFTLEKALPFV
jgi:hypothetical protein